MPLNVSIIYTHQMWGDALYALINAKKDLRVSKVFHQSKINTWVYGHDPIYLLEGTYPDAKTLSSVRLLKNKEGKVILLGYLIDNEFVELLLSEGLDAFVLKTCCKDSLFEAINKVNNGFKYFCGPITELLTKKLHQKNTKPLLTEREKDVLVELVCMKRSREIAEKLNISEATVRTHRKNIMYKFGTKNYIGLLRYACREGILDSPGEKFCVGCKRIKCESALIG
nr:response regulator transcription factor [uncultured Carboxylicivirga sp.]